MAVTNAYRLCLALLKQDSSGTAYSKLPDPKYASLTWNLSSIIPTTYDFTNFQSGDIQIETAEKNTITTLAKTKDYDSGAITPPTFTFASMVPADSSSIVSILSSLTGVDDPFKVLLLAGVYTGTTSGVRKYNIFNACVAILTSDGGRTAEAKGVFTGSLGLQACHLPLLGTAACGATLSWTESSGDIQADFSGAAQTTYSGD